MKTGVYKFPFQGSIRTPVWFSESAIEVMRDFRDRDRSHYSRFLKKLEWAAKNGFGQMPDDIVRPEGSGILAFGIGAILFRLCGFYDGTDFICLFGYWKPGLKRGPTGDAATRNALKVRTNGNWERRKGFPIDP